MPRPLTGADHRPAGTGRSNITEPVIRLATSDIACRILTGEPSQLNIKPDGVNVDIQGGVPRIHVQLLGPFLHQNIVLRPGCALKRQIGSAEREFELTFWCDDAEGLQRALAQFWGADEKDQPR